MANKLNKANPWTVYTNIIYQQFNAHEWNLIKIIFKNIFTFMSDAYKARLFTQALESFLLVDNILKVAI